MGCSSIVSDSRGINMKKISLIAMLSMAVASAIYGLSRTGSHAPKATSGGNRASSDSVALSRTKRPGESSENFRVRQEIMNGMDFAFEDSQLSRSEQESVHEAIKEAHNEYREALRDCTREYARAYQRGEEHDGIIGCLETKEQTIVGEMMDDIEDAAGSKKADDLEPFAHLWVTTSSIQIYD